MPNTNIPEQVKYTYEQTAEIIYPMLPYQIKDFYETASYDTAFKQALFDEMREWLLVKGLLKQVEMPEMKQVIYYILDTRIKDNAYDVSIALEHARLLKKGRRDYMFKKIREEMGEVKASAKGSHFIDSEWEYLRNPSSRNIPRCTKEEFFQKRFNEVKEWAGSTNYYLFNFPYFRNLPPKRQTKCFILDIELEALSIIYNKFYHNAFGFITKTPDITFGLKDSSPIVSWQSSAMKLEYEVKNDKVIVYESINAGLDYETRLIVAEISVDASTPEKAKEAIQAVKHDFDTGIRARTFDTMDYNIITTIINNLNINIVNGISSLKLPFSKLAKDVFSENTEIKTYHLKDLLARLNKLALMHITSSEYSSDGKILSSGIVSFYDLAYRIQRSDTSGASVRTIAITNNNSLPDFSSLTAKDFSAMTVDIIPGVWMRNQWKSNAQNYVASQFYRNISSQKGKFLFQLIQGERMKIYPDDSIDISLLFIKQSLRYNSTLSRLRKDIIAELQNLQDNSILVKSYNTFPGNIHIEFLPLTTEENIIYKTTRNA